MATHAETKPNVCSMCLVARAVGKIGTCEHFYCKSCLQANIKDQVKAQHEVIACPACRRESRPDGPKVGEHDNNVARALKDGGGQKMQYYGHGIQEATGRDQNKEKLGQANCKLCHFKEHAGHTVESFNNAVFTEVKKVRCALKDEERWLKMLKADEKELQESKATAQEMEDVLIKSIEDHAEKCVAEILRNREVLKKQVRAEFEVVRMMEKRLQAMPKLQRTLRDVTAAANQLLNEQAELHSTYVEKLVGMKQQLDKLKEGHPAYEENREMYQKAYEDVRQKDMKFYRSMPNCKIGGFQDLYAGPRCDDGGPCVCETCEQKADVAREVECRQKGTCTCGTCGCMFNRLQLSGVGCCKGYYRYFKCTNQITVGNMYSFP